MLLLLYDMMIRCDVLSALCPQSTPKEVVSVSNMGESKRGPIIESRDHLLLEFTDGSACLSDGLQLTYTTRIHLVCSRGSGVSDLGRRVLGSCRLLARLTLFVFCFVFYVTLLLRSRCTPSS